MVANKLKNNKNNKSKAFTITEALIVMILVTIFVAATANVFVKRTQDKVKAEAHGRLECVYIGNQLYQHKVFQGKDNGLEALPSGQDYCEFTPNRFLRYVMINMVGAGTDAEVSGSSANGGTAGTYKSLFYPNPLYKYRLYPGKIDPVHPKLGNSIVKVRQTIADIDYTEAATANVGASTRTIDSTSIDDLTSCVVSDTVGKYQKTFNCGASGRCVVNKEDGTIVVYYCRRSSQYRYDVLRYNNSEYEDKLISTGITPLAPYIIKDVPKAHKGIEVQYRYKSIVHAPMEELMQCNNVDRCDYFSFKAYTEQNQDPLQEDFCASGSDEYGLDQLNGYYCDMHQMKTNSSGNFISGGATNLNKYRGMSENGYACLFKLTLGVPLKYTALEGQVSGLSRYINVMQYQG